MFAKLTQDLGLLVFSFVCLCVFRICSSSDESGYQSSLEAPEQLYASLPADLQP